MTTATITRPRSIRMAVLAFSALALLSVTFCPYKPSSMVEAGNYANSATGLKLGGF